MSSTLSSAVAAATKSANKATPQGGVLEHVSPVQVDPKNPIILFIIQVPFSPSTRVAMLTIPRSSSSSSFAALCNGL